MEFESFDVNRLRDVVSKATGIPADVDTWGRRIGGGDAIVLNLDTDFNTLGDLCRRLEVAHALDDYRDSFDWIDYIQPTTDPGLVERLEGQLVERLRARNVQELSLAPPEIVDWDRVASFRFHFDRPQGRARSPVLHPDLRLADYLSGLSARGRLRDIDVPKLRSGWIRPIDDDGTVQYQWSVWKCLVAELTLDRQSYILDEGEFFQVRFDYMQDLDSFIDGIPSAALALPASSLSMHEQDYNRMAAANSSNLLLLDRKTIRVASRTTPIEICDLLTSDQQFIHVKRHLGSSDLSHLFAQGLVSAESIQMSPEVRRAANAKVAAIAAGRPGFDFLDTTAFVPSTFEVVYAIIERWNGRAFSDALPFFSRVNLREVVTSLRSRGFSVSLLQISA